MLNRLSVMVYLVGLAGLGSAARAAPACLTPSRIVGAKLSFDGGLLRSFPTGINDDGAGDVAVVKSGPAGSGSTRYTTFVWAGKSWRKHPFGVGKEASLPKLVALSQGGQGDAGGWLALYGVGYDLSIGARSVQWYEQRLAADGRRVGSYALLPLPKTPAQYAQIVAFVDRASRDGRIAVIARAANDVYYCERSPSGRWTVEPVRLEAAATDWPPEPEFVTFARDGSPWVFYSAGENAHYHAIKAAHRGHDGRWVELFVSDQSGLPSMNLAGAHATGGDADRVVLVWLNTPGFGGEAYGTTVDLTTAAVAPIQTIFRDEVFLNSSLNQPSIALSPDGTRGFAAMVTEGLHVHLVPFEKGVFGAAQRRDPAEGWDVDSFAPLGVSVDRCSQFGLSIGLVGRSFSSRYDQSVREFWPL